MNAQYFMFINKKIKMRNVFALILFFFSFSAASYCQSDETILGELKKDIALKTDPRYQSDTYKIILKKGQKVPLLEYDNKFFTTIIDSVTGFIHEDDIWKNTKIYAIINEFKDKKESDRKLEWKAYLIEKYGERRGNSIFRGTVWIGMTKEMCMDSKGSPIDKNITISANYTHEQWIYPDMYIYFDDGILSTIQKK